jgi:hypothetical protein
MTKLQTLLTSRKFWAATTGLGLIIIKAFRPDFPITQDQITAIVVILVGYIMGTAIQDSSIPRPPGGSATGNPPPAG